MGIQFEWDEILKIFDNYFINNIISKCYVLLAIQNFNELKSLANYNAKIRSSLKIFTYYGILTSEQCDP